MANNKTITVNIRSNYGNQAIYPACPSSIVFAKIAGKKTLSTANLEDIKKLGYEVVVLTPTL